MKTNVCALAFGAVLVACGSPGRPSGLPSPDYAVPTVEPWPPASAAAANAVPPDAEPAGQGVEPAPEEPAGPRQNAGGSGATLPAGTP